MPDLFTESAQRELGQRPERVVIGRPVHFVDDDSKRDQRAEESLLGLDVAWWNS